MRTKKIITARRVLVALGVCLLIGSYNYSIAGQWQEEGQEPAKHHMKEWCKHHPKWVTRASSCRQAFHAHIQKEKQWCSNQATPLTGKECKRAYEQQEHQNR